MHLLLFCGCPTVIYIDAEGPRFSNIPSNINQNTDAGENFGTVSWTPPTATDNSGTVVSLTSSHNSGDTFHINTTTTVTYTATDPYSNDATMSFTVTVTGQLCYKSLITCNDEIRMKMTIL